MDTIQPAHHGKDHAPGGEDPIPNSVPWQWAELNSWTYRSTNTVPANTWTAVTTGTTTTGTLDGGFQESFVSQGFSGAVDATGDGYAVGINMPSVSMNFAVGWVQFNEDFASGDVVGVAIQSGGGNRIINSIPCDGQASDGNLRFSVCAPAGGDVSGSSTGARLEVYQHSTGTKTLRDAQLYVFQFSPDWTQFSGTASYP